MRDEVLAAFDGCGYRAREVVGANTRDIIWEELADAAWLLAALLDLRVAGSLQALRRALENRLAGIRRRILLLLSFTHDPGTMKRAGEQLRTGTPEQRALALEIPDTHLPRDLKTSLLPLFENLPVALSLRRMSGELPQQQLGRSRRLEVWIRACAIRAAAELSEIGSAGVVEDCATSENQLVRETALWALSGLAPDRCGALLHGPSGRQPRLWKK